MSLDTHLTIKDHDSTIEDAQRALYFGRKVDVARGINNINLATFPVSGNSGGSNSDSPLLLLVHPVGGSAAGVAFDEVNFVFQAGAIKNCFGRGGFTRVDMGDDADIADF